MKADNRILKTKVVQDYKRVMLDSLSASFPKLTREQLEVAINWSILNRHDNKPAYLDNNYTKRQINGTVLDILDYINKLEPIVTASGVLYKKHKEANNPMDKMIMGFLAQRSKFKITMYDFPKGSALFEKYNLLQLLEKLNANATYGVLGSGVSLFYNLYVAEAITTQGRSYISCSITLFESFLANNIKFNSLNEIIIFIDNIINEKAERKFDDFQILARPITREEVFLKLLHNADPTVWIPTEKEMLLLWERLQKVYQEDLNRIFYKNNLYCFCDLPIITEMIINILKKLDIPFMNPNKPPKIIEEELNYLTTILKEYVYYGHFYIDKLDRIDYMQRDVVTVVDTDSCMISFDGWYRYILNKVYNIDMPIKREKFDMMELIKVDEFGDKPKRRMMDILEPNLDYDFYTDEIIELHHTIYPMDVIPQDGLKYSIINIITYVCSELVVDYLDRYCTMAGSNRPGEKCSMIMKNEFLFKKLLLTPKKKNYASLQLLQEGNIVPNNQKASLGVSGLPINKSTLPDKIKAQFQKILYEDVLNTNGSIDQIAILKKLVIIEKQIVQSILNKETTYYKPDNIGSMSSYADPTRINGVMASVIYNEIRTPDMPAINLDERNKIFKVKTKINRNNVEKIKDTYPEVYEKLIRLLNHPKLSSKLETIAFPIDSNVPDWILEFVDINTIVNDNLKNFPLDSIGLKRLDNDSVNYSNIVKL